MPVSSREIALRAFSSAEWGQAVDALFQATGIIVSVMDFAAQDSLTTSSQRCGYCHMFNDVSEVGPLTCFDVCPAADSGAGRVLCRTGLPVLYSPVKRGETIVAHVVVSGFVTSTRERRGLYERLLQRGISEDSARRAIKSLPVIARRQAEAYLQMAVASASTVYDATAERAAASERIAELKLFVSAGHHVVSTERLDAGTLGGVAEEAVALIGGEAGAILRSRGTLLEVVARTEAWRGSIGALVPRAATASGRAAETGRTVVAPGKNGGPATLAMPLVTGENALGVLEVRMPAEALPVSADRLARLGRFGQFIAIALEREDERAAVDRAMAGYSQLNELAARLGGQTDINAVARLLIEAVSGAFAFGVAGLVFTGWGRDQLDLVLSTDVTRDEINSVVSEISGHDIVRAPMGVERIEERDGRIVKGVEPREWAMAAVELVHGDLNLGYLFVARADGDHYTAQDRALLDGIATHGAASFGRSALFERVRDDYAKTIAALSATLDLGERAGQGHAGRVMEYAVLIGEELDLGLDEREQLRFAGLLHDIGKTGVPEEILLKPSKLNADEIAQVQRHAEIGASVVDQIDFLKSLTPIILHHHERWDGKGYPHGLKGDAIPLLARVLAAADSFDAMTTERSYAKKLTTGQARDELVAATGTQFDPRVVAALLEALDRMALAGSTGLLVGKEGRARKDLPA